MNNPRRGTLINETIQGGTQNKWLILFLVLLSFIVYWFSLNTKGTPAEWLQGYVTIISTVLLEAAFVIYIVEDSIRRAEERRITQMKRYLEFERQEGRRYEIEKKIMTFDIVKVNGEEYLKYIETLNIKFGDPVPEVFNYPIFYDIPGEIKSHKTGHCPRIAEVKVRIKGIFKETESDFTEQARRECTIYHNAIFCPLRIPLPNDVRQLELKITRCYKYKEEHGNYFFRMIQDPVWAVKIEITDRLLRHIKKLTANSIEIIDYSFRKINHYYDIITQKKDGAIEFILNPRPNQLRNRFYIMDRIMVKVMDDEALGASSHEESTIPAQNN